MLKFGIHSNSDLWGKRGVGVLFLVLALSSSSAFASVEKKMEPEIVARTYSLVVKKRNKDLYLFRDIENAQPKVGSILLLRKGDHNLMGLRVVRVSETKKHIIAKIVKEYGNKTLLGIGKSYTAVEKLRN